LLSFFFFLLAEKTRIAGKISYELNCAPQHVEEQNHLLQSQIEEVEKAGQLKILKRRVGQRVLQVGTNRGADWDNSFIKAQPKPTKAKKMEQKTTRMPENELMDLLFKCYSGFAYWPLRALKAQVKQPEAWLRQVLEQIAVLQKTGTFANTWTLKDEYQHMVKDPNSVAPDVVESDSDDEDGVTYEDVV
jgi:transcription initiation factor TFIIF subunit beta